MIAYSGSPDLAAGDRSTALKGSTQFEDEW